MWIMWKSRIGFFSPEREKHPKVTKINILLWSVYFCRKMTREKRNPQPNQTKNVDKVVDNVDN